MAHTDPLPAPGSVVQATIDGQTTLLTIDRYGHGIVYTSDWRGWWCGQPGHEDGRSIRPERDLDRLHLRSYGPLVLVQTQGVAA